MLDRTISYICTWACQFCFADSYFSLPPPPGGGASGGEKLAPEKYFGVWPLRFSRKFKLNRLPADCGIFSYNGSQHIAKFIAGRFSLPANTGRDNNNNTAVITTAHPNNASLCNLIPGLLMFNIVVMTQK